MQKLLSKQFVNEVVARVGVKLRNRTEVFENKPFSQEDFMTPNL